jgi:hypothetical protein
VIADVVSPGAGALSEALAPSWPAAREPRPVRSGSRLRAWLTGAGLVGLVGLGAAAAGLGAGPLPLLVAGLLLVIYGALAWVTGGGTVATLRQRVLLAIVQFAVGARWWWRSPRSWWLWRRWRLACCCWLRQLAGRQLDRGREASRLRRAQRPRRGRCAGERGSSWMPGRFEEPGRRPLWSAPSARAPYPPHRHTGRNSRARATAGTEEAVGRTARLGH